MKGELKDFLREYGTTQMLINHTWYSLSEQQRYRAIVKYELQIALDERKEGESKRSIYRAVASNFNYTMGTIEKIANTKLK